MHIRLTRGEILETRPQLELEKHSAKPGLDRYCPSCARIRKRTTFTEDQAGKLSRLCIPCQVARQTRPHAVKPLQTFQGVDIDRIHYLRGAVCSWRKNASQRATRHSNKPARAEV
jgi:hypothetical protein